MPLKEIKAAVYQELLNKVMDDYPDEENTESGWDGMAGVANDIHFYKNQFETTEEADKFFANMRRTKDRYLCMAVKVLKPSKKSNKKEELLRKRIEDAQNRMNAYMNKHHVKDYKSQLIGCKSCGSKINKDFVKEDDLCPLCGYSFLSPTTLEKIESYRSTILKFKHELKELVSDKAEEERPWYWYVTTAYHS